MSYPQHMDEIALNISENELQALIMILDSKEILCSGEMSSVVLENVRFKITLKCIFLANGDGGWIDQRFTTPPLISPMAASTASAL
jgi:hypothetical protein